MTITEVENHFASLYQCCSKLGLKTPSITKWRKQGYIPLIQQYRIAELTDGALMPDEESPSKGFHKKVKVNNDT